MISNHNTFCNTVVSLALSHQEQRLRGALDGESEALIVSPDKDTLTLSRTLLIVL